MSNEVKPLYKPFSEREYAAALNDIETRAHVYTYLDSEYMQRLLLTIQEDRRKLAIAETALRDVDGADALEMLNDPEETGERLSYARWVRSKTKEALAAISADNADA
jgi:hypothetical protein